MKVEDSEKLYGKRWDDWSKEQEIDHAKKLTMEDLTIPLNIRYSVEHFEHLTPLLQLQIAIINARGNGNG